MNDDLIKVNNEESKKICNQVMSMIDNTIAFIRTEYLDKLEIVDTNIITILERRDLNEVIIKVLKNNSTRFECVWLDIRPGDDDWREVYIIPIATNLYFWSLRHSEYDMESINEVKSFNELIFDLKNYFELLKIT